MSGLAAWLQDVVVDTELALDRLLPQEDAALPENSVRACMRYAVFAGGKRFRPALVYGAFEACGGNAEFAAAVARAAAALEMVHTYSLMQDDMPCMDDDDLRRGRLTSHKKFEEAAALLASDGLQTGAFEVLADEEAHPDAGVRCELVRLLAVGAGALGMVGGQAVDMAFESLPAGRVSEADLRRLQGMKTGALIGVGVEFGAVLAGADEAKRQALREYAAAVGLAFQVWDDVLDETADAATLGKTPGKDVKAGKATFVSLLGLAGAEAAARAQVRQALAALDGFGAAAEHLRELARYAVEREK